MATTVKVPSGAKPGVVAAKPKAVKKTPTAKPKVSTAGELRELLVQAEAAEVAKAAAAEKARVRKLDVQRTKLEAEVEAAGGGVDAAKEAYAKAKKALDDFNAANPPVAEVEEPAPAEVVEVAVPEVEEESPVAVVAVEPVPAPAQSKKGGWRDYLPWA